jgi:hypothetical protein
MDNQHNKTTYVTFRHCGTESAGLGNHVGHAPFSAAVVTLKKRRSTLRCSIPASRRSSTSVRAHALA